MLKNKKYEGYLLINRIWGTMLSLVMVVIMLVMAGRFELISRLGSRSYRTFAEIATQTDAGNEDVDITVKRADYAGYDYYVDSERRGRYYYCEEDGRFAILLLDSTEDVVLSYKLRGRVMPADDSYDEILAGLAADIGIDKERIRAEAYDMVVSEIDFPRIYYNMMLLVLVLSVVWLLYRLADCIYVYVCPWKNPGSSVSVGGRMDRNTIIDVDEQLRHNVYYEQDGIVITDKYFVYHGMWRTDIVELSNIETYKKLKTTSNISGGRRLYKLLMTDTEGVTYEQNFKTESSLDEAITFLMDKNEAEDAT